MSISDEDLRALLADAAPTPAVRDREALLDSLVSRVEAGGVDVADSPAPAAVLAAVTVLEAEDASTPSPSLDAGETAEVSNRPTSRRWGRLGAAAASVSVAGWVAIGVGSAAAAAAGAWMMTHGLDGGGPDGDEPLIIERAADDDDSSTQSEMALGANPLPTIAPVNPWSTGTSSAPGTADSGDAPATDASERGESMPAGAVDSRSSDSTAPRGSGDDATDGKATTSTSRDEGKPAGQTGGTDRTDDSPDGGAVVEAEVNAPVVGGILEDTTDGVGEVLDDVSDGVKDTTEDLEDTVVDIVPDGPLRDTVKPVIDAVDVSGLVAWVLDSLLCATDSAVAVTARDNVGVEDVELSIGVAGSTLVAVDLSPSGGNTWSGAVSPLSALDLGLLNRVVSVEVTAVDAAGNTATKVTQKTVQILSCLG